MSNNKLLVLLLVLLFIYAVKSEAFRIPRPDTYTLPWTEDQMKKHNEAHEDLWNLQNGEFNFDIVDSVKTNANNGDLWFINTGGVVRIQYKANDTIYTITADGY